MFYKSISRQSRMKKLEKKIIAIICMVVVFVSVFYSSAIVKADGPKTVYLDAVNGSDYNSGTSELPWQTLKKAQSSVNSGDTVILRNGSYGEYSESCVNRTDWVTYKAEQGHKPEFRRIFINWNGPASNTYLRFDGITIRLGPPDLRYNIVFQHSSYMQFLNLNVIGVGARDNLFGLYGRYCNDITVDNCIFSGGDKTEWYEGFGAALYFRDESNIVVTNNEIRQFYGNGITINSTNSVVRNNNIHNFSGDAGIGFGGGTGGLLIENNRIHKITVYNPELKETPTQTTWNEDGTIMTNPGANWGSASEPYTWENRIEIVINSGINVKPGDNEVRIDAVISPTQIRLKKSIKNDPNGLAPSNVDYVFRDQIHADLIQAYAFGNTNNVTIRGNELYDSLDGWAFMHLKTLNFDNPGTIGGFNFIIENNLFWNSYNAGEQEYHYPINIENINGVVFRNNIVIGRVQIRTAKNIAFFNNIISYIQIYDDAEFTNSDYNIFNRGTVPAAYNRGSNTTFLCPGLNWNVWNAASFTSIFADYEKGNFQHASATSLGVGHGDPLNSPSIDINQNSRDKHPDAGCYEFKHLIISLPLGALSLPPMTLIPDSGNAVNE